MRVVTQLIHHFWQRRGLTLADVDHLIKLGFVQEEMLPGYAECVAAEQQAASMPAEHRGSDWELMEERFARQTLRSRRDACRLADGRADVATLCERIRTVLETRLDALRELRFLSAWACEDPKSPFAALRAIARWDQADYDQAMMDLLSAEDLDLSRLWQAVDVEPYRQLASAADLHPFLRKSFLAVLDTRQRAGVGKYGWILAHGPLPTLVDMRSVQSMLLTSLKEICLRQPRWLVSALDADGDPCLAWALLLVFNAHRHESLESVCGGWHYRLASRLPPVQTWRRAWEVALQIDHHRVSSFLTSCRSSDGDSSAAARSVRPATFVVPELWCPDGWRLPAASTGYRMWQQDWQ